MSHNQANNGQAMVAAKVNYSEIGQAVDHELAAKMVKNFNDAHPELEKTFIIGKQIIDQIFAQPGCVAISIDNAINEYGKQTLVYYGVDENGRTLDKYPAIDQEGKLYSVEGLIGDRANVSWLD